MARVKRGVTAHAKHKKVLKAAKGYYGRRKNTIRVAKARVDRLHRLSAIQGRLPLVVVEHRAIVDALDAGDAEGAIDRLAYHLDRAPHLLEMLRRRHEKYFVD